MSVAYFAALRTPLTQMLAAHPRPLGAMKMAATLRKGKTKTILESSIDSALLAVEVYNKPRTSFRSEAFISLMIISWTRLFHAYFNHTIGNKYYYKKKSGRYETIDGERKAWELATCIRKYGKLSEPVKKNLQFFIKLRNKVEHRHIDTREVDALIFGECQALLYNYENLLIKLFGKKYALNEALVYSLQFSQLRTKGQIKSSKSILSKDLQNIIEFVNKYRTSLSDEIYDSQEYSIKLLQIPKVSNTNKSDLAIEFVKFDELSEEDKQLYDKIAVLVKDRKIKVEGSNVGQLKPGKVVEKVNQVLGEKTINLVTHRYLYTVFNVRPPGNAEDPFDTNTNYCHYDEPHNDYVYSQDWVDFIIHLLQSNAIDMGHVKKYFNEGKSLNIEEFEP